MRTIFLVAALVALQPAHAFAKERTPTYWNVTYDGQHLKCASISSPSARLISIFETKHRTSCVASDEGDYLLFTCGDVREVVLFSREICMGWEKKPKSDQQTRTSVVLLGCMKNAKPTLGLDSAVLYCACAAEKIGVFTDDEISRMSIEKIGVYGKQCESDLDIVAHPSDQLAAADSGSSASVYMLESAFATACNTGMVISQKHLPPHPDAEKLLVRGYASCKGALARWSGQPGGLAGISGPVELVCGYAVGAMFAKYGFGSEVQTPLSERALAAAKQCVADLAKQGISNSRLSTLATSARAN